MSTNRFNNFTGVRPRKGSVTAAAEPGTTEFVEPVPAAVKLSTVPNRALGGLGSVTADINVLFTDNTLPVPPLPKHGDSSIITHIDVNADGTALVGWAYDTTPEPLRPGWTRIENNGSDAEHVVASVWPRTVYAAEFIELAVIPSVIAGTKLGDAYPHLYDQIRTQIPRRLGTLGYSDEFEAADVGEALRFIPRDVDAVRHAVNTLGTGVIIAALEASAVTSDDQERTHDIAAYRAHLLGALTAETGSPVDVDGAPFLFGDHIAPVTVGPALWNHTNNGAVTRRDGTWVITTKDPAVGIAAVFVLGAGAGHAIAACWNTDRPGTSTAFDAAVEGFAKALDPTQTAVAIPAEAAFAVGIAAALNTTP